MELSYISNDKICSAGVEESMNVNSDSPSISKLNRKNKKQSVSKEDNHQKNNYKSNIDFYGFDCKIVEQTIIEKSDNDISSNKISKKKRIHKAMDDDKNASECKIAETLVEELGDDTYSKYFKGLKKQKKKKHNLLGETNVLNGEESVIDKPGKNVIQDALEVHKGEGVHKQFKEDNVISCKTYESDQNGFNKKNFIRFHEKKNKKRKLFNEMKNTSDCETADFTSFKVNINDSKINIFHEKKKKKREKKLVDEMKIIPDFETEDSNYVEITQDGLSSENVNKLYKKEKKKHKNKLFDETQNEFDSESINSNPNNLDQNGFNRKNSDMLHEKKKHKLFNETKNTSNCEIADFISSFKVNRNDSNHSKINVFHEKKKKTREKKLLDEMKIITDFKTEDSNYVEITQDGLNSENVNKLHKKEEKNKNKLLDEIQNASDSESVCSNPIDKNQIDLNKFQKEGKWKHGYELFSVAEDISDEKIKKSAIVGAEKGRSLDTLLVKERKKYKLSDVNKISDHKTIDSESIGMNDSEFSNEIFYETRKEKKKNHRKNLTEVECMANTVTESSDNSNNTIHHEYTKYFTEKSILQNPVVDISLRTNKEHMENSIEVLSDNLLEKKKTDVSKVCVENYQENACMSFDPFIHDKTNTPVSFPVPLLHEDETVCSITEERRAYLEKNGVTIYTGKWTKVEDGVLIRNFQQFGLEFGVNNPFQLLGINQSKKDNEIEKFKKAKHFLIRLGRDLDNRSLRSIYMRARKLLTPFKNRVKLSEKETTDLKHAYQLVGNKWTRISDMVSKSEDTCHTAIRWHKDCINKGKWTLEEERNLIKAIRTVSGEEDISANNLKNLSWKAVAKYVPTRNEFQCHKHWAEHLSWDSSVSEKKSWDKSYFGKLIYLLKEKYCFSSENEIDWRELHKHFIDVAPSYIFLHKKWLYLKGRLLKEINLSYGECLDTLKKKYEKEYKMFVVGKL